MEYTSKPKSEFTEMLEGMTKQELVKYANMTFGLSLTARYAKHELVETIQQAQQKFQLNDNLQFGASLEEGLKPGYAEIQLHRTELLKGLKAAIVGLNGKMASLPIGTKFGCPLEYVDILQNAVRMEYVQDTSVNPPELLENPVHAYPFTIHNINPHTPESEKLSAKLRGIRGRKPIEERMAAVDAAMGR
jgi:hypothetical protein